MTISTTMYGDGVVIDVCDRCRVVRSVGGFRFLMNIGFVVGRFEKHSAGLMCRSCVSKTFCQFTLATLILGWWSVTSLFIAPAFVFGNIGELIKARGLLGKRTP